MIKSVRYRRMHGSKKLLESGKGEKMQNKDSETGMAEDMLRSIVQLGAAEMHYQTLYNKSVAQLENGLIDVENDEVRISQLDKIRYYQSEINDVAEVRRRMMRKLFSLFPDGNKDAWCLIKHLGVASMTAFEAYQASNDDSEMLDLYYDINKEFNKAVTDFLGAEITDCAACVSDFLKGEKK